MANGAIVILTGAGISQESGLDTFRDVDGIWSRVRVEDVATPDAYRRDPSQVHAFYNARRRVLESGTIEPNAAHRALVRLECAWPHEVLVVTQNIDDLHERAGNRNIFHMHGELLKGRCDLCGAIRAWSGDMTPVSACLDCGYMGRIRPHVVWFGEVPLGLPQIFAALDRCRTFISIGTSGNVYPAAGFVSRVRNRGVVETIELNLEPSQGASLFDEAIYGPATETVPAYVERLLREAKP
jgi:NAD-dependent deacetylase